VSALKVEKLSPEKKVDLLINNVKAILKYAKATKEKNLYI